MWKSGTHIFVIIISFEISESGCNGRGVRIRMVSILSINQSNNQSIDRSINGVYVRAVQVDMFSRRTRLTGRPSFAKSLNNMEFSTLEK